MSLASNGASLGRRETVLPEGSEIARQRAVAAHQRPTFQEIADQYGVSRQAVHRRLVKWMRANPTSELSRLIREQTTP